MVISHATYKYIATKTSLARTKNTKLKAMGLQNPALVCLADSNNEAFF